MQKVNGAVPKAPVALGNGLTLVQYDDTNFGFLRIEISKTQIVGTYFSAPYSSGATPAAKVVDSFTVDLAKNTVVTGTGGSGGGGGNKKPTPAKKKKKR
jgi:hypothetical protein